MENWINSIFADSVILTNIATLVTCWRHVATKPCSSHKWVFKWIIVYLLLLHFWNHFLTGYFLFPPFQLFCRFHHQCSTFSANMTTWSMERYRCSLLLKLTMTKGDTDISILLLRSAIIGYVQMLGFALSHSSSGMISALSLYTDLTSISTTLQALGTLTCFFSDTVALEVGCNSFVSAMTQLS